MAEGNWFENLACLYGLRIGHPCRGCVWLFLVLCNYVHVSHSGFLFIN